MQYVMGSARASSEPQCICFMIRTIQKLAMLVRKHRERLILIMKRMRQGSDDARAEPMTNKFHQTVKASITHNCPDNIENFVMNLISKKCFQDIMFSLCEIRLQREFKMIRSIRSTQLKIDSFFNIPSVSKIRPTAHPACNQYSIDEKYAKCVQKLNFIHALCTFEPTIYLIRPINHISYTTITL